MTVSSKHEASMSVKVRILELMQPGVKLTADEIAGALALPVLSVRPRVCELHTSGKLTQAGERLNKHGNMMKVWVRRV